MGTDIDLFAFFYMWTSNLAAPFVEDDFSPLYIFSFFVKNQVFIGVWVFYSISLAHLSAFMPIPSCFHYYSSIVT